MTMRTLKTSIICTIELYNYLFAIPAMRKIIQIIRIIFQRHIWQFMPYYFFRNIFFFFNSPLSSLNLEISSCKSSACELKSNSFLYKSRLSSLRTISATSIISLYSPTYYTCNAQVCLWSIKERRRESPQASNVKAFSLSSLTFLIVA